MCARKVQAMRYRGRPNKSIEKLIDNIKRAADESMKETAEELTYLIEFEYRRSIDLFYDDKVFAYNNYDTNGNIKSTPIFTNIPHFYQRTGSTYQASSMYRLSDINKNVREIGNGFIGGISISSDNIPGNPYRAMNKEWVFNRTFAEGIHGVHSTDKKKYKDWFSDHKFGRKNKGNALWYSAYENGKVIGRFRRYIRRTKPSPKDLMDRYYNMLNKPRGNRLIQEIYDKSFNNKMKKYL